MAGQADLPGQQAGLWGFSAFTSLAASGPAAALAAGPSLAAAASLAVGP